MHASAKDLRLSTIDLRYSRSICSEGLEHIKEPGGAQQKRRRQQQAGHQVDQLLSQHGYSQSGGVVSESRRFIIVA